MQALEQAKPATVQQLHHQVEWRCEVAQNRLDLIPGQHDRDVWFPLRPDDSLDRPKLILQNVPMEEQ